MAKGEINFHCGCGYTCKTPVEAAIHADTTGHTLDVHGIVKPEIKKEK